MSILEAPEFDGHEHVLFINRPEAGLKAIIALHSTRRGPAMGGCRMWPYANEQEAIRDVLRLSRAMTYKAAVLGLDLGGGKTVVIGDSYTQKTPELFRALGRSVDMLGGRYIVAEDVGTNPADMKRIRESTRYVVSLNKEDGGNGDPAPLTALGTLNAIRAGIEHRDGVTDLAGVRVAVQGIGNVGFHLCRLLHEAGAKLIVSDILPSNAQRAVDAYGARKVDPGEIYAVDADVFSPCALGAVLNDQTIGRLKARVVAGAANNQLDEARHARVIEDKGITFVPDYVASSGGMVGVAAEWTRSDEHEIKKRVRGIYDTALMILRRAREQGITPDAAAETIAVDRLRSAPSKSAG